MIGAAQRRLETHQQRTDVADQLPSLCDSGGCVLPGAAGVVRHLLRQPAGRLHLVYQPGRLLLGELRIANEPSCVQDTYRRVIQ